MLRLNKCIFSFPEGTRFYNFWNLTSFPLEFMSAHNFHKCTAPHRLVFLNRSEWSSGQYDGRVASCGTWRTAIVQAAAELGWAGGAALSLAVRWSEVKVAQLCPILCNPVNHTVHGILQTRTLGWVASPFSRVSSQPRDRTQVSPIAVRFFTSSATREAPQCNGNPTVQALWEKDRTELEPHRLVSLRTGCVTRSFRLLG